MMTDALLRALGKAERVFAWQTLGYAAIVAFVIFCIYRIAKFFIGGRKEQKLIRMELSKLAEEVRIIRQKLENHEESDGAADPQ